MFLKCRARRKDGKIHRRWSVVESRRVGRRVVQKHVLYLGEVSDRQRASWERAVSVIDETSGQCRQRSLIPEDRAISESEVDALSVRLSALRLERPRQWGACWLADSLWRELHLDVFFAARLGCSREDTGWEKGLRALTIYRLLAHKEAIFAHLRERWSDLFAPSYGILLYDLASTSFECDAPAAENDPRQFGYSRERCSDCVQVVIAMVVTPEGLPLAYEMMPGHTADKTILPAMIALLKKRHGQIGRLWVMDRGIPTEDSLARMRACDPPMQYLVGKPKARLHRLEAALAERPWVEVRGPQRVKCVPEDGEVYVLTESSARVDKERAMRRRSLKKYWKRLGGGAQRRWPTRRVARRARRSLGNSRG